MSNSAKKEYLIEIRKRYSSTSRNEESLIFSRFPPILETTQKATAVQNKKDAKKNFV